METKEILEKLDNILELLGSFSPDQEQSKDIGTLMGALAKAQGSYKRLVPNERSAQGPYANLEAILVATREALSKNAIAFLQRTKLLDEGSGASLLRTYLCHESGQFTSTTVRTITGKTLRETGNALETHKRSEALNILGLAPSGCDPILFDDDGGEEEESKLVESIIKLEKPSSIDPNSVITKAQYNELMIALGNDELTAKSIMKLYKIETLADLPKEVYHEALAKIRRIKKAEEEYSRRKK